MGKTKLLILIVAILFIMFHLQSCCTMKGCLDNRSIDISLEGFSFNEIDTIILYRFKKNTNFTDLVQTANMHVSLDYSNNTYSASLINNGISIDYDYKIEIKHSNQLFFISNFRMKKNKCNLCLFGIRQDFYETIEDFEVNGQKNAGYILNISK